MDKDKIKLYKHVSLVFSGISVLIVVFVVLVTFIHKDFTSADPWIYWTVEYHFSITVGLIMVSLAIGYTLSTVIYKELRKSKEDSKKLMDLLVLFLDNEEREIISYLVKQKRAVNQADISRLPGMNRVKAYRILRKMQQRDLIDIIPHGKIRRIALKIEVLNRLLD